MSYVTGVIHHNCLDPEALDAFYYKGIDLGLLDYIREHGNDESYNGDDTTFVLGFKKNAEGKYEVDETAEVSAIWRTGHGYIQVVHSRWVASCHQCSPCYPGQGDLATPGDDYMAYTFGPEWFDEGHPAVCKPVGIEDFRGTIGDELNDSIHCHP